MKKLLMFLLIFVFGFFPMLSQADTAIHPLKLILEKEPTFLGIKKKLNPDDVKEDIFRENDSTPILKESFIARKEMDISVSNFFETSRYHSPSELHFGMIPIPAIYFQSKHEDIQFLALTTVVKVGFVFRYYF